MYKSFKRFVIAPTCHKTWIPESGNRLRRLTCFWKFIQRIATRCNAWNDAEVSYDDRLTWNNDDYADDHTLFRRIMKLASLSCKQNCRLLSSFYVLNCFKTQSLPQNIFSFCCAAHKFLQFRRFMIVACCSLSARSLRS